MDALFIHIDGVRIVYGLGRNTQIHSMDRQFAAEFPRAYTGQTPKCACKVRWILVAHREGNVYHFSIGLP